MIREKQQQYHQYAGMYNLSGEHLLFGKLMLGEKDKTRQRTEKGQTNDLP
jgi:hypothetical protein